MELRAYAWDSADYRQAVALRQKLLRDPLGLRFSSDDLAAEADERHFGAYARDGEILATLSLKPLKPGLWKMRQVAVSMEFQGTGIGRNLVYFAENQIAAACIELHARATVVGFYEKLGYTAYGPEFLEVTLPHRAMRKKLLNSQTETPPPKKM
jgi:predicted GNAT family N-acyltransferase